MVFVEGKINNMKKELAEADIQVHKKKGWNEFQGHGEFEAPRRWWQKRPKKGHGKGYLRITYSELPETKETREKWILSREERSSNNRCFSKDPLSSSVSTDWLGRDLEATCPYKSPCSSLSSGVRPPRGFYVPSHSAGQSLPLSPPDGFIVHLPFEILDSSYPISLDMVLSQIL